MLVLRPRLYLIPRCVGAATFALLLISGRTDLRNCVSEAKFDAEADFDVKKTRAPQKSAENHEERKNKLRTNF